MIEVTDFARRPEQNGGMNPQKRAALKASKTRRIRQAWELAHRSESASKKALQDYCKRLGWRVAIIEGPTGAPRTGIVDAVAFRIDASDPDRLEIFLIQLKGGRSGMSGREIARLKKAAEKATLCPLYAVYDGERVHVLPCEEGSLVAHRPS